MHSRQARSLHGPHVRLKFAAAVAVVAGLTAGTPGLARAATVPTGFVDESVGTGFTQPVGMAFLPDGRILVIEQKTAAVRLIANGVVSGALLTVSGVNVTGGERGLLGVAVDPGWPARPYVYFHFTATGNHINVRMYTASGDLTNPTSLNLSFSNPYTILNTPPDNSEFQNGGTVRFGRDGKLYVSLGDDANKCQSQLLQTLQACILRLDVSSLPLGGSGPPPYATITPADNPFVALADSDAHLIDDYGLRNPFRFCPDMATGNLYIGDVGESSYEEYDEANALGMNFGWPKREGAHDYAGGAACQGTSGTDPIYEYDRTAYASAATIGGPRYRPATGLPVNEFPSSYFGDCFLLEYYHGFVRHLTNTGGVWSLAPAVPGQPNSTDWATGAVNVSDLIEGPDGALYYVQQFGAGSGVRRIRHDNPTSVGTTGGAVSTGLALAVSPNPARASRNTTVSYTLPAAATVRIGVYDATGARITTIFEGEQAAGVWQAAWNGLDSRGSAPAAGVYFIRLEAGTQSISRKFALIR